MRSEAMKARRRRGGATLRTYRLAGLLTLLALSRCAPAVPVAVAGGGARPVSAVGCVEIPVSSVAAIAPFYEEVLAFQRVAGGGAARARLALGTECVELAQPVEGVRRPVPADSRSNDLWFQHIAIVVSDLDAAYRRLEERGVAHVSVAPQTLPAWNPNAGGIRAYYFRDPDGHTLELIWFPPGKGPARWQERTGALFLGIDHTAIASSDTARSLGFYQRGLGLKVAGGSENYGVEQERLSGVTGARVRITTLRAEAGPGIELLEYLAPRDGRPRPALVEAGDLTRWRVHLAAPGVTSAIDLRDPDGHELRVEAM